MALQIRLLFLLCLKHLLASTNEIPRQEVLAKAKPHDTYRRHQFNFSSPAPHLFSSIHGLLRQGYNTFFPNGHVIVPCEIPAFSSLYHGWLNEEPPKSPEWLAFTHEMAYGIMGSTRNSYLFTYRATRPIKVLYIDGASGALGENGTMDTQMLLLHGNITGPPVSNSSGQVLWDEYSRAEGLCSLIAELGVGGPEHGFEGWVRMSAGFELIWCNFSSPSLQLVSKINVTVPLLEYNRTSPTMVQLNSLEQAASLTNSTAPTDLPAPDWEIDWEHEPFVASQMWDWFISAGRSYTVDDLASRQEPALRVLGDQMLNLYSPSFASLSGSRVASEKQQLNLTNDGLWKGVEPHDDRKDALRILMRRRSKHRVDNLDPSEVAMLRRDLTHIASSFLEAPRESSNYVSWNYICELIVQNYSKRLQRFQKLLGNETSSLTGSPADIKRYFILLRERSHAFLAPFLEYSSDAGTDTTKEAAKVKANAQEHCKAQYLPRTAYPSYNGSPHSLSDSAISETIEEVMSVICSTLIDIGVAIEQEWAHSFNRIQEWGGNSGEHWMISIDDQISAWREDIEELTAWLGWAPHWMHCDRLCDWDEECYIPLWPIFRQLRSEKPAYPNFPPEPAAIEHDLWHPSCLKITDFPAQQRPEKPREMS